MAPTERTSFVSKSRGSGSNPEATRRVRLGRRTRSFAQGDNIVFDLLPVVILSDRTIFVRESKDEIGFPLRPPFSSLSRQIVLIRAMPRNPRE